MLHARIALLVLASLALPLPLRSTPASPKYVDEFSPHYSQLRTLETSFAPASALETAVVTWSPRGTSVAEVARTDGSKVPYEREEAHIRIASALTSPFFVITRRFRGIRLSWTNDRILVLRRNIGHLAEIVEVLDVVEQRWLAQYGIVYGAESDDPGSDSAPDLTGCAAH